MKRYFNRRILSGNSKIVLLALLLFGCQEEALLWQTKAEQQVMSEFIAERPEFSEFQKLLQATGMDDQLAVRGPFTLFLPNNDVMLEFYKENGVTSFTEFTDTMFIYRLIYNHLIPKIVETNDIGLGAIRDTNALGDYLVTEFEDADIIINKQSRIIDRDIIVANGVVHEIDKVIDPVTVTVYDQLTLMRDNFSLFVEGIELTGLKDTLSNISFPYGKLKARSRFTILAVPDTIFERYELDDVNKIIDWCRASDSLASPDPLLYEYTKDLTSLNNPFYRFMEYHCMSGTHYLNNLKNKQLYPILSADNNISVIISDDYRLNTDKVDNTKYTSFIVPECNIPSKNGTIHTINDLLPVVEPEPTTFIFDVCSYIDIQQGDWYGKYYHRWYDGQNDLAKVKWEGDMLQYYYKNHDSPSTSDINMDELQMFGFWWLEITTPKIMKGRYKFTADIWGGDMDVYVDGVRSAVVVGMVPQVTPLGEFTWTKTEEHKIKLVATSWTTLFWDSVIFTPVTD